MFRTTVILFLCGVLAYNKVSCDPMVKMNICSDTFDGVISSLLNKIERTALRYEKIDDLVKETTWPPRGRGRKSDSRESPIVLQVIKVSFHNIRVQIISKDKMELRMETHIQFREQSPSNGRRRNNQNNVYGMTADIISNLNLQNENGNLLFGWDKCEVYIRKVDENWLNRFGELQIEPGKYEGQLKTKLCKVLPTLVQLLNRAFMDIMKIGPPNAQKLVIKNIEHASLDCLEICLNLLYKGTEKISEQKHGILKGNGVSLLKDYVNEMLDIMVNADALNKLLRIMDLKITPEELRQLIPDVYETESLKLKITLHKSPHITQDSGNATVKISANVQGFSSKSEDPVVSVEFDIYLNAKLHIKRNKIIFTVTTTGVDNIHSWFSTIGKTGDIDFDNLATFLKNFCNEKIMPTINKLQLHINFPNIPGKRVDLSDVVVKTESVEILRI